MIRLSLILAALVGLLISAPATTSGFSGGLPYVIGGNGPTSYEPTTWRVVIPSMLAAENSTDGATAVLDTSDTVGAVWGANADNSAWWTFGGALNANTRLPLRSSHAFEFQLAPYVGTNAILTTATGISGANGSVTYAKIQNVAASRLLGNPTGSPAAPAEISLAADHAFSGTSLQLGAFTGDITKSAGALATTIASNAVTYAKFQQVAASSLVGNATGSLANATGITLGTGLTFSGSALNLNGAYTALPHTMSTAKLLGRTTASSGAAEEIGITGGLTLSSGNLGVGALTPSSVASTGAITSSSPSAGLGYATGSGVAVTQATNKATTAICNAVSCAITTNAAALAATTTVTFTVTDSAVAITDVPACSIRSGNATAGTYQAWPEAVAAGSFKLNLRNMSAGSLSEAIVINCVIIKGVSS